MTAIVISMALGMWRHSCGLPYDIRCRSRRSSTPTLEALRPTPGEPRFPARLLIRIEPFEGIIGEALLVLHAVARHRFCPENLRDFRKIIPQYLAECRWYAGKKL